MVKLNIYHTKQGRGLNCEGTYFEHIANVSPVWGLPPLQKKWQWRAASMPFHIGRLIWCDVQDVSINSEMHCGR